MAWRSVPRQLLAVAMGSVLLGGCGSLSSEFGASGVGVPEPAIIAAFYDETDKGALLPSGRKLTAGEYLLASLSYTNEKCHVFFERLESFKQDSQFLDKVLTAAIAAGSPLLSLSSSAEAIANVTSGIASANLLNKHANDIYAFASFRESLKNHVLAEMADYQAQRGLDLYSRWEMGIGPEPVGGGNTIDVDLSNGKTIKVRRSGVERFLGSSEPSHLMLARSMAADYASICSLANMRRIIDASLNATTTRSIVVKDNPIAPAASETVAKDEVDNRP